MTEAQKSNEHAVLVRQYFNENAQSWHDYYMPGRGLNKSILKDRMRYAMAFLEKYLQPAEGKKVLDAGCGSGIIGVGMAGRGYFVHGWDISEEMITISEKVFKREGIPPDRYQLTFGNLLESDLEAGSFDGIMALGFIQYQTDEKAVMDYLNYLLRPGGVLVMSGPVGVKLTNYFGLADKFKKEEKKTASQELLHTISANYYSVGRFRELMSGSEFEMLAFQGHGYAGFEFISGKLPQKYQGRIHRALTKISKVIPFGRYGNDMVVVGKKKSA